MAIARAKLVDLTVTRWRHSDVNDSRTPLGASWPLHVTPSDQGTLPIQAEHYVMLLDWTERELRVDKRGAIPDHLTSVVDKLGLNRSNWVETVRCFG
jgi:hypothetical protein